MQGDLETAKDYAQDAISLDMNSSDGYYYLALVREKMNELDEVLVIWRNIVGNINNNDDTI